MNNKLSILLSLVAVIFSTIIARPVSAQRLLYSVSVQANGGPNLRIINPSTGATIIILPITLAGFSVLGSNGLARDPTTGKLWALLQVAGGGGRRLVTLNPGTGVATLVGNTGDNFAGLAFSAAGTLYGVTGDGAAVAETLFTLNKTTAAATAVKTLGNGNDGEAIGYNPNDNKLYHASGNDAAGSAEPPIFESIDLANLAAAPVNIPRSGFAYVEALALTHSTGNTFLLTDGSLGVAPWLIAMTTSGTATALGVMDHDSKGLAFLPTTGVDFDGDGKTDIAIYRDGVWSIIRSLNGGNTVVGLGGPTWTPVPADYDGDGKTDTAVYLNGTWVIIRSSDSQTVVTGAGGPAFIPVPADYDGDGKADIAVYSNGVWSIIRSSDSGNTVVAHGGPGWTPVPSDYDGDGKTDIAVYINGAWSVKRSSDNGNTVVPHGGPAWTPVPADYDGDGKADVAAYTGGAWSIIRSLDGGNTVAGHGGPAWTPVPADYDGDGKTDISVYLTGAWSIKRSSDNGNTITGHGGAPQDIPLSAQ